MQRTSPKVHTLADRTLHKGFECMTCFFAIIFRGCRVVLLSVVKCMEA